MNETKEFMSNQKWFARVEKMQARIDELEAALDAAETRETVLRAALTMDGQTVQGVLREYAAWVAWPHSGYDPGPPVLAWADRIDAALALPDAGEAP